MSSQHFPFRQSEEDHKHPSLREQFTLAAHDLADHDQFGYAKGELERATVSGSQTIGSTSADLTDLSVTVNVDTNRLIKITGHGIVSCDSGERAIIEIREGSTALARIEDFTAHSANQRQQYDGSWRLAPSSGSHTYKLHYRVISGSGHEHVAGTGAVAFMLVEDIGPA